VQGRLGIWLLTGIGVIVFIAELWLVWGLALALAVIAPVVDWRPLAGALLFGSLLTGAALVLALRRRRWAAACINSLPAVGHLGIAGIVFGPILLAKNITYILNDGFTGDVEIVFKVPGGVPEELGKEGVVYRIPADGLLLSASSPIERSVIRSHFYYQKQDGSLEPIADKWFTTIQDTPENRVDPTIGVYLQTGIGSISWGSCKFPITGFRVGTMSQHLDSRSQINVWDRLQERGLCKEH
jgi:hypothetical protein